MGQRLTDRTSSLSSQPADGDLFHVVDISDTTDSADGSSKKIAYANLVPDASTTVKGKVELATDAETITGTDTVRAITPSNLTGKIDTDGTLAGNSDTRIPSQKAVKTYVDSQASTVDIAPQNLLKNGNFINNSTNGYGSTPDDWTSSNANPVQGGIPALTKQNLIDGLGVANGDIEAIYNLNGNLTDLSDNAYNLTASASAPTDSADGLMAQEKSFASASSQFAYITNTNCTNLRFTGTRTFALFFRPTTLTTGIILSKDDTTNGYVLFLNANGTVSWTCRGLTTNTTITSDVSLQSGKRYCIIAGYDSAGTTLSISINGIRKTVTASGTTTNPTADFAIGINNVTSGAASGTAFLNGRLQNVLAFSVALSTNQEKKLFAMTMYKGQKIRRATTDAYAYQQLPQDLVERLRGKTVALRADLYQEVASTAQISIHQTMADATTDETIISATDATTGSWLSKVATGTLEADVVTVEIRIKHSTSDGNTWFRNVSLYEGSTLLPYDHSKEDWSRFPRLLKMDIPAVISGYQFEENRGFDYTVDWTGFSVNPTSTTGRFLFNGKSAYFSVEIGGNGTSNNTAHTASLPIVCAKTTFANVMQQNNNGTVAFGAYSTVAASKAINLFIDAAGTSYTASGNSFARPRGTYEID